MGIVIYLAIFMIIIGGFFLILFLLALKNGQFDDLKTPAHKLLLDDPEFILKKPTTEDTSYVNQKNCH